MKFRIFYFLAMIPAAWIAITPAFAQDHITVSSCPAQSKIPVTFAADCSHVNDAASKQLCGAFLQNQACKVFPAYRKITGIHLEDKCPSIQYNIYEKENWPYPNPKGEGGLAGKCVITIMADYSVNVKSKIGPYDLHEILHEYEFVDGPFIDEHPFFDPLQTEAAREIGDASGSQAYLARVKDEARQFGNSLADHDPVSEKNCVAAEKYMETTLYLEDSRNAYVYYLKLSPLPAKWTRADLAARVNRMFNVVSSGKAREFLLDHGCGPF